MPETSPNSSIVKTLVLVSALCTDRHTASNKEALKEIKLMIEGFLRQRGLILSKEKTVITHSDDG